MSWGFGIAVVAGLVVGGIGYLRTTPAQRRLQRARTQRIETSRPWRKGVLVMATGPLIVLLVGVFTTGAGLTAALVIAFAPVVVGAAFLIKAMRAEPKIPRL